MIHRRFGLLIGVLSLVIVAPVEAGPRKRASKRSAQSRPTTLAGLIAAKLPEGVQCGASVIDLADGRTIFERRAGEPLIPASNAKLFTIAAAIDQLGPDFKFTTRLATRGADLVVIGDGDPGTGDPRLCELENEPLDALFTRWAAALKSRGSDAVAGNLVIDDTLFETTLTHPSWHAEDLPKWYAAPVGGLNFNDNVVELTVWPAATAGSPVEWSAVPRTSLVKLENRARSGGKGDLVISPASPDFRFVLSGEADQRETLAGVTVPDPALLFADVLRTSLAASGVTINGDLVRGRVRTTTGGLPSECQIVATHATPLPAVLARIGKNSQNLFAECLLKRMGYEFAVGRGQLDPVGSWATGCAAVEAFLKKVAPSGVHATIADASGLSRDNRASATDFTAVLAYMYKSLYRQVFVDSLSDAGSDGSLEKRMKGLPGRVYAKTGYIRGVRTLSGYAVTPRGDWLAFSVLFNNIKGGTGPLNEIHDEFCRLLMNYERPTGE